MDHNPPSSSVHGIFQARIPEQVAISYCRGSSWPRYWHTPLTSPDMARWFFTTEPLGEDNNIQIRDCPWIKICEIWLCANFIQGFSKTLWYQCPISLLLTSRHPVVSDPLWHHGLQHARPPWPSPTSRACSVRLMSIELVMPPNHLILCRPFLPCLQSFPVSGSFLRSQFFASGGQSIGVSASASVLPMNIQVWFPWRLTGWISLQSKGLSRVFSNTTVQKHPFLGDQLILGSNLTSIHDSWKNHGFD